MQNVRTEHQIPISFSSVYRCPIHNAMIGGAPLSRHKFGDAFDVKLSRTAKDVWHQMFERAGFQGFGLHYRTFIHVDMGPSRSW